MQAAHAKSARNPSLDALRAAAIAAVFFAHLLAPGAWSQLPTARAFDYGQRGVDLFFVLSGYLVGGIALRHLATEGRVPLFRFWRNRWYRTLPAYYVVLGCYLLKQLMPHRSEGLGQPWSYFFFLQGYVVGSLTDFAHSWSLCVEEHFYLALPVALTLGGLAAGRRVGRVALGLLAAGLALVALRTWLLAQGAPAYQKLSHWRTDGLVVGVSLAALELHDARAFAWLRARAGAGAALAALLLAGAVAIEASGSPHWQPAYALAFGLCVALGIARHPALEWAGARPTVAWVARVSYSLYLYHPLVIGALLTLYFGRRFGQPAFVVAYLALSTVGSLVVSWLSYRFVEVPCLRLRDARAPGPQPLRGGRPRARR